MANRNWANGGKIMSMHVAPVIINGTINIGATGAVASIASSVVLSVVRAGTGLYTVTLQPNTNFSSVFCSDAMMQSPVSGLSGIIAVEMQNAPNATIVQQVAGVSGGVFTLKTIGTTGSLADPASGSAITFSLYCNNSSVPA